MNFCSKFQINTLDTVIYWINIHIIIYTGKVCTSRDVSACSSFAQSCESFKPPADKDFAKMFPKAYAQVCVEPTSGDQCLYTDVKYDTCDEARIS